MTDTNSLKSKFESAIDRVYWSGFVAGTGSMAGASLLFTGRTALGLFTIAAAGIASVSMKRKGRAMQGEAIGEIKDLVTETLKPQAK